MVGGFFAARWNGSVSVERLFFFDMLLVGTLINVAGAFGAVLALGFKAPDWLSIAIYLASMPYNVFLVVATTRAARRMQPNRAVAYSVGALLWLAASMIV